MLDQPTYRFLFSKGPPLPDSMRKCPFGLRAAGAPIGIATLFGSSLIVGRFSGLLLDLGGGGCVVVCEIKDNNNEVKVNMRVLVRPASCKYCGGVNLATD